MDQCPRAAEADFHSDKHKIVRMVCYDSDYPPKSYFLFTVLAFRNPGNNYSVGIMSMHSLSLYLP